jgi:CRISPR-associated protein Cmr6
LWVIPKSYALRFDLQGVGVSSLLRNDEPEFRANMFKASLRGHASRLLAGVCNDPQLVKNQIDKLFGHTKSPGCVQLYWEWLPKDFEAAKQGRENTPIYQIKGSLHVDIDRRLIHDASEYEENLAFMRALFQFTYVMGGFGKSWRRIWHKSPKAWENVFKGFLPSYQSRAIGCHWQYLDDFELETINTQQKLTDFLQALYQTTQRFISIQNPQYIKSWRESWSPSRVAVYCSEPVYESSIINLFHQDDNHPFKTTPAICGKRKVKKQKNGKESEFLEFHVSSVWHRMLPLGNNQYLEIVSVFHGDRKAWKRDDEDQLFPFINALKERNLHQVWGNKLTT